MSTAGCESRDTTGHCSIVTDNGGEIIVPLEENLEKCDKTERWVQGAQLESEQGPGKTKIVFCLTLFFTLSTFTLAQQQHLPSRQPKLFFVSSTTSTTTISTQTVCYVASSTAIQMLTCKKKKRSILSSVMGDTSEEIKPASSIKTFEEAVEKIKDDMEDDNKEDISNILSGLEVSQKEGRFLNYWLTTTITTTFTTYTATSSLASLVCTPAGYTNDGCSSPYGKKWWLSCMLVSQILKVAGSDMIW